MSGWEAVARLLSTRSSRSRRLESLVGRLQLRNEWTVDELVTAVARMRGRSIVLAPLPESTPVGLCGLWLARPDDDVVLYRKWSDPLMERHVLAHEVAHMMLGHGRETLPAELAAMLVGLDVGRNLKPSVSTVRSARGVSPYDDDDEYDAEVLATLIETGGRRGGLLRCDRRASVL